MITLTDAVVIGVLVMGVVFALVVWLMRNGENP